MRALHEMTNAELVGMYNGLVPEDRHMRAWKGKKEDMVRRIEVLQGEQAQEEDVGGQSYVEAITEGEDIAALESLREGVLQSITENKEASFIHDRDVVADAIQSALADETISEGEAEELAEAPPVSSTIRESAIELLCTVAFYEDKTKRAADDNVVAADHPNARSVGLPYDLIIAAIKRQFKGCDTTVACLRWYAVKIRVEEFGYEGLRLPQRRPRVKPAKA